MSRQTCSEGHGVCGYSGEASCRYHPDLKTDALHATCGSPISKTWTECMEKITQALPKNPKKMAKIRCSHCGMDYGLPEQIRTLEVEKERADEDAAKMIENWATKYLKARERADKAEALLAAIKPS